LAFVDHIRCENKYMSFFRDILDDNNATSAWTRLGLMSVDVKAKELAILK